MTDAPESNESFKDILLEYEKSHTRKAEERSKGLQGTVIAVTNDSAVLDIGYKTEGILSLAGLQAAGETVKPGDKLMVTVTGRDPEGYYELSRGKVVRVTDWGSLESAFAGRETIVGTVSSVIKGGLSVDVGVRAFLPASRSGARDAAAMEELVGQQIHCRITKLDVADEDVVVDRRAVLEEEERATKQRRYSEIQEGETISGTVRSLTDFGAFVDIGGVDALLHVSDIAWNRINKPSDVLAVGQQVEVKVLKVDPGKRRISLGMKQLQPHPWDQTAEKFKAGERVRGVVTRIADFGAFVELEPGIEGLIHISEMSWSKRVNNPSEIVKPGDTVEAVILNVNPAARRISLGLKQALGDPWADAPEKFPVGSAVEGPVTSLTKFGAFVKLAEGVEGMVHISEITNEKRINHPQEVLKVGQVVKAVVLEMEKARRMIRLSIKQTVPSSLEEYIAEHHEGDLVTGRMGEVSDGRARVELGEGVQGMLRMTAADAAAANAVKEAAQEENKTDLASLSSMLNARWRGVASSPSPTNDVAKGQIRSFRISKLDAASKTIELELAEPA